MSAFEQHNTPIAAPPVTTRLLTNITIDNSAADPVILICLTMRERRKNHLKQHLWQEQKRRFPPVCRVVEAELR